MGFKWKTTGKKMDFDEKDTELIELLAKVKSTDSEYPVELLTFRRQQFMEELGEMGVFAGLGMGLEHSSSNSSMSPVASSIVETVLVIAIVAEAGVVAFLNRDKLTEIFKSVSSATRVEQVSTSINPVSMPVELELTNTAYWDSTPAPSVTVTMTSSLFPSPTGNLMAEGTSTGVPTASTLQNTPQVTMTPDPKGNNGNHYGQTPKPERTKENGNNPKDPKKTKEPKEPKDPKPTKKPKGK